MSNEFGYIPESPEQKAFANKGIFTPTDIYNLDRDDKWTQYGQLELIETQTVSGVSAVNFTSIEETKYNVHYLTYNNITPTATGFGYHNVRLSNDGGSSYESSNYDYANFYIGVNAGDTSDGLRSTTASEIGDIFAISGTTSTIGVSGYMYFYQLGDSTKYSFTNHLNMGDNFNASSYMYYGFGAYHQNETMNAIQWFSDSSVTFNGDFSLYGVREYS